MEKIINQNIFLVTSILILTFLVNLCIYTYISSIVGGSDEVWSIFWFFNFHLLAIVLIMIVRSLTLHKKTRSLLFYTSFIMPIIFTCQILDIIGLNVNSYIWGIVLIIYILLILIISIYD